MTRAAFANQIAYKVHEDERRHAIMLGHDAIDVFLLSWRAFDEAFDTVLSEDRPLLLTQFRPLHHHGERLP